ncbi:MAG: thiamine pyrophosphate-dependent enzyme, partial [Promethearchaeota archaeon]
EFVLVSGIGQAGKFPHFIKAQSYNGLHGRYLSAALGIKASNPELTVIAVSGDGCTLSEGGNHFLHTIRYNPDIVNVLHNNQVYGLTKGQASPTSQLGFKTKVQVFGVINEPFNALAVAISLNASFVARAFVGDLDKTKELLKKAINHKGYALIDLLCPCVTFNRINTFQWYKEHSYYIDDAHDPYDQMKAMKLALDTSRLALGVLYKNQNRRPYSENVRIYNEDKRPLYQRDLNKEKFNQLLESLR